MKNTVLLITALLVIAMSFTGCHAVKGFVAKKIGATLGDLAGEKSIRDGARMEYVSNTADSLTVKIENLTDSTWQSGNMRDYFLEAERDGEWYTVNQIGEFANTMELMLVAPGDEFTHTFTFTERYGKLKAGRYRVVKSFWANETETVEAGEFHLICEFVVE